MCEKIRRVISTFVFIHQVVFYVICVVAPLYNRVMWLFLQSGFLITQLLTYRLVFAQTSMFAYVHLNKSFTMSVISIKNVLSRFIRPAPGMLQTRLVGATFHVVW